MSRIISTSLGGLSNSMCGSQVAIRIPLPSEFQPRLSRCFLGSPTSAVRPAKQEHLRTFAATPALHIKSQVRQQHGQDLLPTARAAVINPAGTPTSAAF